jgi:hypothetical protein
METARIDDRAVRELAGWSDGEGILSLYCDASPERLAGNPSAVERAARSSIVHLVERCQTEGPPHRARALEKRLDRVEHDVTNLLAPGEHGAGRALFLALADDETRSFATQEPFPDGAWLHPHAVLVPLVIALERGRPAGLVSLSRTGARVVEWQLGQSDELTHVSFHDPHREWQPLPPGERGAHTRNAGPQRDLFQRRALVEAERGARGMVGDLVSLAERRRWREIVIAGDDRIAGELAEELGSGATEVLVDRRRLRWKNAHTLGLTLEPVIREARAARTAELVARIIDAEHSSQRRGVAGKKATLAALREGRVQELALADSVGPGDLDELIALAYETDATVHVVDTEGANLADGVGGLLRW